ncbi:hypothetical protein D9C73_004586 [Collichthys lucidus]|uniref:ZP-N domain-containing protein n=1 Tax=Collichthys lucidus TaxID=240159 RepID=A0A4U5U860_COLLU|nr:hypothetical protein D9C73_004586 [Collichthys lucidus]
MASTQVLLLQLLLVSLASASHHYGGTVAFTYKGRNPDGTLQVDLRTTSVFRGCYHDYSSSCYTGNCGYVSRHQRGVVDSNTNASYYSIGQWCETETVETWKDSCTIDYRSGSYDTRKVFGFEMVVEDFPHENVILSYSDGSRSSRAPLSYNYTHNHSTNDNSTNHNSTKHNSPVRHHYSSQIQNIFMTGPLNISRHRTTHNEFVIRWTPTPDNLGEKFPVCFAVESVSGSTIYQSEMRCVLVDVGKEQIKSNVICNESTMTVEVEKSSFAGLHEEHLRLIDPSSTVCSLQTHSNSTHVIGVIPLNACGTEIEVTQGLITRCASLSVTVMNLNLNLVFIAGCLLAAVGMVSAVVMYKAKVSRVKYQPLPTFEN